MVKILAISLLVLAGTSVAGAITHLISRTPPTYPSRGPKKFKVMTCTLLAVAVLLIVISVALLRV
jgi:high-affinity Fe2+/Pb2+ permease